MYMHMPYLIRNLFISLLLVLVGNHANAHHAVRFFVSNNTEVIDLQTAFDRLISGEQAVLHDQTITLLQKNHIEQSRLVDVLGVYAFQETELITADNSIELTTSPEQELSDAQIVEIANMLAHEFEQESVAVYIPKPLSQSSHHGITVMTLPSNHFTIADVMKKLQDELPVQYSQALTLRVDSHHCNQFMNVIVNSIEWLGGDIDVALLAKAFPRANVLQENGDAYLVYSN